MICETVNFSYGLPLNISCNSLSPDLVFNRAFKMIWVLKGKLNLKVKNNFVEQKIEQKNEINLNKGDLYLINGYTPYRLINNASVQAENRFLVFDFKSQFLKDHDEDFSGKIFQLNNGNLDQLKYLLARLSFNYLNEDYQLAEEIEVNLNQLLDFLNNHFCINNQRQDDFYQQQRKDIIIKVIDKLEADYMNNLRLKD
ncbi:MAG: AraC family transcriptional regulator, partial [Halanaerobium sp.]